MVMERSVEDDEQRVRMLGYSGNVVRVTMPHVFDDDDDDDVVVVRSGTRA